LTYFSAVALRGDATIHGMLPKSHHTVGLYVKPNDPVSAATPDVCLPTLFLYYLSDMAS